MSRPRHSRKLENEDATRRRPMTVVALSIVAVSLAATYAPVRGLEYTVAPGDALWTIASEHGVTIDAIVDVNEIANVDHIVAGRTLTIPAERTNSIASTASGAPTTHVVSAGDTLWDISIDYDVPLGALARLNGIGADAVIRTGQTLELPKDGAQPVESGLGGSVTTMASAADDREQAAPGTHVAKDGDTLWAIATRWGLSLDQLLEANGLSRGHVLQVGQALVIPDGATLAIDTSKLPADLANSVQRLALMPVFDRWASEYSVPADLLKALAWFESGWNNDKRSSADAIGIGQILPITADFVSESLMGQRLDPEIPEQNIRLSARYLRYLLDHAGSVDLAVASYYQGLTATRQHGIYESSEFYVEGILNLRERFR